MNTQHADSRKLAYQQAVLDEYIREDDERQERMERRRKYEVTPEKSLAAFMSGVVIALGIITFTDV